VVSDGWRWLADWARVCVRASDGIGETVVEDDVMPQRKDPSGLPQEPTRTRRWRLVTAETIRLRLFCVYTKYRETGNIEAKLM
jgi:hypothetical protein